MKKVALFCGLAAAFIAFVVYATTPNQAIIAASNYAGLSDGALNAIQAYYLAGGLASSIAASNSASFFSLDDHSLNAIRAYYAANGSSGAVSISNGFVTNLAEYVTSNGKSHREPYWTNVNFFTLDDMAYMDESNHVLMLLREDSANTNRVLYVGQEVGLNADNTHDQGQSGMSAISYRIRAIHDVDGSILPYHNPNPRIVWTMGGDIQNTAEFAFENETNLFFKFYDLDTFTIQFYKIVSCNNFTNPTIMTFGTNRIQMELEAGTQITAKTNLIVSSRLSVTNGVSSYTNSAVASSAITFPATTASWTNTFGINIVLYINNSGVTGTTVSKNGQQIFSVLVNDITLLFKPGDYFAETYSAGTPTARWEPQ